MILAPQDIPAPDVDTDARIMAWIKDTTRSTAAFTLGRHRQADRPFRLPRPRRSHRPRLPGRCASWGGAAMSGLEKRRAPRGPGLRQRRRHAAPRLFAPTRRAHPPPSATRAVGCSARRGWTWTRSSPTKEKTGSVVGTAGTREVGNEELLSTGVRRADPGGPRRDDPRGQRRPDQRQDDHRGREQPDHPGCGRDPERRRAST